MGSSTGIGWGSDTNRGNGSGYSYVPPAPAEPPKPDWKEQLGTAGNKILGSGNQTMETYSPQLHMLMNMYSDQANGRFNPVSDAARSRFIDTNNAGFDSSADRIKQIWSGFGRSGNPLAAKSLAENEMARTSALSGFDTTNRLSAAEKLHSLMGMGLNLGTTQQSQGLSTIGNAGNLQAGHNAAAVQAQAAPAQNLLGWGNVAAHAYGGSK